MAATSKQGLLTKPPSFTTFSDTTAVIEDQQLREFVAPQLLEKVYDLCNEVAGRIWVEAYNLGKNENA